MDITRLTRNTHRHARPAVPLLDRFDLTAARAHELCGAARRRLALWVARAVAGPVLWIRPGWHSDQLHMAGLRGEIDPGRLVFVTAKRSEDLLWSAEEALRSGAVALVVADLSDPPGLTQVRRLHLAAEAGADAPLCLLLTPGDGGAPGVDSRWSLDPDHAGRVAAWRLARLRGRDAPPGDWRAMRRADGTPMVATEQACAPVPA